MSLRPLRRADKSTLIGALVAASTLLAASCGGPAPARSAARAVSPAASATGRPSTAASSHRPGSSAAGSAAPASGSTAPDAAAGAGNAGPGVPLAVPAPLNPFATSAAPGQGVWQPAGRLVDGVPAIYETRLVPPGGTEEAGVAWMDTRLLSARLYSGSKSPGGGPYLYTAPIQPAQAQSLVAAFNGGFLMPAANGGYYTEGRVVDPLVAGAASLVIYSNGYVDVGAWGTDVSMTPAVVAVRQNLIPLVAGGQPTPAATSPDWQAWGATCGVVNCSGPGVENQWRSAVGVTADGALVYAAGPALAPDQLAELLVRAGVVRGMELDINPDWPVFATYDPPPGQPASPANGVTMLATVRPASTFFQSWWARDFITMSARTG